MEVEGCRPPMRSSKTGRMLRMPSLTPAAPLCLMPPQANHTARNAEMVEQAKQNILDSVKGKDRCYLCRTGRRGL